MAKIYLSVFIEPGAEPSNQYNQYLDFAYYDTDLKNVQFELVEHPKDIPQVFVDGVGLVDYPWQREVDELIYLHYNSSNNEITEVKADSTGTNVTTSVVTYTTPYITVTKTDVTAYGANNGTIAIDEYTTYPITRVVWGDTSVENSTRTNLPPGTYSGTAYLYEVPEQFSTSILEPSFNLSCEVEIIEADCSTAGMVTLTPSGGEEPFTVTWPDGSNDLSKTNVPNGTYDVLVSDANGVSITVDVIVDNPDPLKVEGTTSDGEIILDVTGGYPPYSYTWSHGENTKDVYNLVPGTYSVTIEDTHGCNVIATFNVRLSRYQFAGNPISIEQSALDYQNKLNLSFLCDVYIKEEGAFKEITRLEQPSDNTGATIFNLQKLIASYVNEELPDFFQTEIKKVTGHYKEFYTKITEKYGAIPSEQEYAQSTIRTVILGGLSFIEHSRDDYYNEYALRNNFLTWQTEVKNISEDQHEYLYYITQNSHAILKLNITIKYDDGSEENSDILSIDNLSKYEIVSIPVGFKQLQLEVKSKKVNSYSLRLTSNSEVVSEEKTYKVNRDYEPYAFNILYLNSLGGFDTIRLKGKKKVSLKLKETVVDNYLQPNYKVTDPSRSYQNKSSITNTKFSTGYLTKEEVERLQDFLLSKSYYLMTDDYYLPVTVSFSSPIIHDDTKNEWMITGIINYPETDYYTPTI